MIVSLLRRHRAAIRPTAPDQRIAQLAAENARLRQLIGDLRAERADMIRANRPVSDVDVSGLPRRLPVGPDLALRTELARHTAALMRYEDRLALYEGRPSPIACPRACCSGGAV